MVSKLLLRFGNDSPEGMFLGNIQVKMSYRHCAYSRQLFVAIKAPGHVVSFSGVTNFRLRVCIGLVEPPYFRGADKRIAQHGHYSFSLVRCVSATLCTHSTDFFAAGPYFAGEPRQTVSVLHHGWNFILQVHASIALLC